MVRQAYNILAAQSRTAGLQLPRNSLGPDLLLRKLDCAVIRSLHTAREQDGQAAIDSVRAAYFEGRSLYKNSGFASKSHIQICVRHPACIKGYFRPLDLHGKPLAFTAGV